jgi:hypothetical protein
MGMVTAASEEELQAATARAADTAKVFIPSERAGEGWWKRAGRGRDLHSYVANKLTEAAWWRSAQGKGQNDGTTRTIIIDNDSMRGFRELKDASQDHSFPFPGGEQRSYIQKRSGGPI